MRRRGAWLAVVVWALVPSAARAASVRVDAPVKATYVELAGPAYAVDGVTSGSLHGVVSLEQTAAGGSFSGSFNYADARGTLRGTSKGQQHAPVGTSIAFVDTIAITDGTGIYRGAHGKLSATDGAADTQSGYVTEHLKGTLTVGRPARRRPAATRAAPYHATVIAGEFASGSKATVVGTVHGLTSQNGLIVLKSPQQPGNVTETYTYYDGLGSISGSFLLVRSPQPDGTIKLTSAGGTAHGTGRYAHVTGLGATTFAGQRDHATGVLTIHLSGRLRFSH